MVRRIDSLKKEQGPLAGSMLMRALKPWNTKLFGLKKIVLEEVSIMQRRISFFKKGQNFRSDVALAADLRSAPERVIAQMTFVEEVLSCGRGLTI